MVLGLTIAAAVFAGWATLRWWDASNDESLALAKTRDQVLIAAHANIETLQTLDYREVEDGLDAWLSVTTGELHEELAKVDKKDKAAIEAQAMITKGRVIDAAVLDLSAGGKDATVIAAVETTLEPAKGEITLKRHRFTANLSKVDGDWLLTALDPVPVMSP